jgi:ATP-dependent Clp protease adaptor protein ClpS
MSTSVSSPESAVTTQPKERTQHHVRRLPPYHVILENDDHHSMEFVIAVLRKVFGYTEAKAYTLMLTAHTTGRAVVWTGAKEVAELKVEQIRTFHEDRSPNGPKLGPLSCCIEEAPG